jgi:hypothetical protein
MEPQTPAKYRIERLGDSMARIKDQSMSIGRSSNVNSEKAIEKTWNRRPSTLTRGCADGVEGLQKVRMAWSIPW